MGTTRARLLTLVMLVIWVVAAAAHATPARAAGTADISVTLSGPTSVNEGEDAVYTANVKNAGPDWATGVVVTDRVPSGVVFDASRSVPSSCSASGATVTCPLDEPIPPQFHLGAQIAFRTDATGMVTDAVSVTETATDPTTQDHTASLDTTVNPPVSADLQLTLNAPAQVYAGQTLSANLPVINHGPDTSTGGSISLSVPAELSPVSIAGCSASAGPKTCSLYVPTLQPGEEVIWMLRFDAVAAGQASLSATVTEDERDPSPSNNSPTAVITVQPAADLTLSSSATPNPVTAGHKVATTIALTNSGPSTATSIVWSTSWSSDAKGGIDFESASVTTGTCALSGATLSCQPGDLAPGQQAVLTLVLQPRSKGTLVIDSSATSSLYDSTSSDNASQATIAIG